MEILEEELISLYKQMSDLTSPLCGDCGDDPCSRAKWRCCDPLACENARTAARRWGVEPKETGHPTLPFMGEHGCTLAPHLRPACTNHLCFTNAQYNSPERLKLLDEIRRLEQQRRGNHQS